MNLGSVLMRLSEDGSDAAASCAPGRSQGQA